MLKRFLCVKMIAFVLVVGLSAMSTFVMAEQAYAQGFLWKSEPVYNEQTGSYYQMVQDFEIRLQGPNWSEARQRAESWRYKRRQGRLAVIDTLELYQWVRETFMLNDNRPRQGESATNTWIGLRYWCSVRELIWVDTTTHRPSDYAPWDTPWHRGGIRCGKNNIQYMSVYISGETHLWRAQGAAKRYQSYIVEYPEK